MNQSLSMTDVIEQLRIRDHEKLRELTRMHLTIMLDLNDQHFEQLMINDHVTNAKTSKNDGTINALIAAKTKKDQNLRSNNCSVFGASLTHEGICVMYQLIKFIAKEENITQEGIFRKSGSVTRQMELRNWLNCGTTIDLNENRFTAHDCATVLKSFLSELPEPLLTEAHFKAHCQIVSMNKSNEMMSPKKKQHIVAKQLKTVQLLLLLLPDVNRKFLHDLLTLLYDVASHCCTNKMDSKSLATLFSPHLLCPKNFSAVDLHKYLHIIADALCFMIDHMPVLFDAPAELIKDVEEHLQKLSLKRSSTISSSPLENDAVDTVIAFCERNPTEAQNEDYTQMHLAQLYAHVQSMPETPQKKKLIKQFNKESGHGTPLTKRNDDSNKKSHKTFGDVLRAGQNFLFRGGAARASANISKNHKQLKEKSASVEFDSPLGTNKNTCNDNANKHLFKRSASTDDQMIVPNEGAKNSEIIDGEKGDDSDTFLGFSFESANKRVKINIRVPGNREPLIM